EARIIAWLAGENWVTEVFKGHGKIYEMTASRMFGVPLERIMKGNPEYELRAKGKVAVLSCGYGGGVGALQAMGAEKMGLDEVELKRIVQAWRRANPSIVRFWHAVEESAIKAVKERTVVEMQLGLKFYYQSGMLFIQLPSGRSLVYVRPRIEMDERFGREKLTYEGMEQTTRTWGRISTYGGKICENIIQAIARDCLAEALLRLDVKGYKIVAHIHDEVILDVPQGEGSLEEVNRIMAEPIPWAKGLPMNADGFESDFYRKE
ncbi:MAG: DNA polymerase, partial [Bacillota bacterium]|nr:DNA polymerase [Bacillota bacterium]